MIIDTSAIVAILADEPERHEFNRLIAESTVRHMSAASFVEAGIVMSARHGRAGVHELKLFVTSASIVVMPVDEDQAHVALDAFQSYGKGVHPAGLNYGDCFSYALATVTGEPLLFKGNDFGLTDAKSATLEPGTIE